MGSSNPDADGTAIHLFDPNPARTNIFFPELSASNVVFKPEPGLMILFPSYVPHAVLAASRRPPPDFDRLQRAPGAFPMTAAGSPRCF